MTVKKSYWREKSKAGAQKLYIDTSGQKLVFFFFVQMSKTEDFTVLRKTQVFKQNTMCL